MGKFGYELGRQGESEATEFLQKNGFKIIDRNFHSRFGEIDIIAIKDEILHFIEVKSTAGKYEAIYRVNASKLAKIQKTMGYYMINRQIELDFQIDLLLNSNNEFEFIENISS